MTMLEVQKADRKTRRTASAIVLVGALVGAALIAAADQLQPTLRTWVLQDPDVRMRVIILGLVLLTTGPAIGMSVFLWSVGRRIARAGRYPPPGFGVWRDTPVVTGDVASARGRMYQIFGAFLGTAGLLLAFFLWRMMVTIGMGAG